MCVKFCFLANINEKSLYGHYKSRVVLSIQSQRLLNAQNELRCDFLIHLPFPGTETHVKYPTQANASSSGVSNLYGCIYLQIPPSTWRLSGESYTPIPIILSFCYLPQWDIKSELLSLVWSHRWIVSTTKGPIMGTLQGFEMGTCH